MSLSQWNTETIKQLKEETGQALLSDEQSLVFFGQDFGKLIHSSPSAVFIPEDIKAIQSVIAFAQQHNLPITIRGNGLSQGGQALAIDGGLTLCMKHFNKPLELDGYSVWVEANTSWADLLALTLPHNLAPYVLPYNCNLPVAGVLSAAGIGASSFKYGTVSAHVEELELIDGLGELHRVDIKSPLFQACLSGQGQFAVITKARIRLKTVKPKIKTFCFVYASAEQWFADAEKMKHKADYMELFCSPSMQGTKLKGEKRVPMAQWLYGMHVSFELDDDFDEKMLAELQPWQQINIQEESIGDYFLRHNCRFDAMKMSGQWDLLHPWYECFLPAQFLKPKLADLLEQLPLHYASFVQIVPIKKQIAGFLQFPDEDFIYEFMILNPGVAPVFKDSCLQTIKDLDKLFLPAGGKRYLSGFIGKDLTAEYWRTHFGKHYDSWIALKKQSDPKGIFSSKMFAHYK